MIYVLENSHNDLNYVSQNYSDISIISILKNDNYWNMLETYYNITIVIIKFIIR